jgi:hypothetical protein
LLPATAFAERQTTREALERFEESFAIRAEDESFNAKALLPIVVVSVAPAFEESKASYPTTALSILLKVFGADGLRMCEACMAPRTFVEEGRLETSSGAISLSDIARLDDQARGQSAAAKSALWLDETEDGVSFRVVDLRTGRLVMAESFDPRLLERARTQKSYSLTRELDRRARGDSLTQLFFDAAILPNQHISLDWADQWGDTNANLSGLTISILDPLLGIGGAYYRIFASAWGLMVGAQVLVSLPSALIQSLGAINSGSFLGDNLVTGVFVIRVPLLRSNYGLVAMLSTNGRVSIGLSLMNISFLPVIP